MIHRLIICPNRAKNASLYEKSHRESLYVDSPTNAWTKQTGYYGNCMNKSVQVTIIISLQPIQSQLIEHRAHTDGVK